MVLVLFHRGDNKRGHSGQESCPVDGVKNIVHSNKCSEKKRIHILRHPRVMNKENYLVLSIIIRFRNFPICRSCDEIKR